MVKINAHVVPAGIAGMKVNNTVGSVKFVGWVGEAGNHDHWHVTAPSQPGKTTGNANKKVGILDEIDTFLQWQIAGKIFATVRDVIPNKALAMHAIAINAEYAVTVVFQKFNHVVPAMRIVPILGLAGTLHGYADVWFFNFARC